MPPDPVKTYVFPDLDDRMKDDPILNFVRRVNDRAIADPMWHTDCRQAVYTAFHIEAQINLMTALKVDEEYGDAT